MPNEKQLERLIEAAWQRVTFAREKWDESGDPEDWWEYRRRYAYVDALEDARLVFRGAPLPRWVELVRMANIRQWECDDNGGHNA